jgi:chemotaxis protein histidine kinase CheA
MKRRIGKMFSIEATKWLVVVGLISAVALGIGLVTALLSVGLSWVSSQQQTLEIAKANERAALADEQAGKANERAGKANEVAATANERAQKLETDNLQLRTDLETATAESRARQAELANEQAKLTTEQRKTAEAQRAADEARLALQKHLEEVQSKTRDRALTPGLRDALTSFARKHFGQTLVIVEKSGADKEAREFADTIASAFEAGGWLVYRNRVSRITATPEYGLLLGFRMSVHEWIVDDLVTVFEQKGLQAKSLGQAATTDAIVLEVGLKP